LAAYLIGDVEVLDRAEYAEYGNRFDAILEQFGGRILANGGSIEAIEGNWLPRRLVILEFPSVEIAHRWYASPEYQEILPIRLRNAMTHYVTLTEGCEAPGSD
jgi:uncharacterized protein (DUF1330 family)